MMLSRYQSYQARVTLNSPRSNLQIRRNRLVCALPVNRLALPVIYGWSNIRIPNAMNERKLNLFWQQDFTGHHWIVRHADTANVIISSSRDFTGTTCSVARSYWWSAIVSIVPEALLTCWTNRLYSVDTDTDRYCWNHNLQRHSKASYLSLNQFLVLSMNVHSCAWDQDVCNRRRHPWSPWWHFYRYIPAPRLLQRSDQGVACHPLGQHFSN
jgi:hypothetical protein